MDCAILTTKVRNRNILNSKYENKWENLGLTKVLFMETSQYHIRICPWSKVFLYSCNLSGKRVMQRWKLVVGSRLNWMKVLGTYMITPQNGIRSSNVGNVGSFYKGSCSTVQTSNSMLRRSLQNFLVFKYVIKDAFRPLPQCESPWRDLKPPIVC